MSHWDPPGPDFSQLEADLMRAVGWYRHPDDPRRHRYWDGEEWHDDQDPPDTVR